jgi:hypothetical protein
MSDEQTIYISPEDDLTTVRERLEEITSRHVTLVIPSHTQLRSHVAWKLLYARSRELGKEVLIVSSDPQVRSVAHAVKFKVAHSLESNPQGRSRPTSRPTRNTNARSKFAPGRIQKNAARNSNALRQRPPEPEDEAWYTPPTPEKRMTTRQEKPDYQIEEVHGDDITEVSLSSRYKKPEKPQQPAYDYRIDQPPALTSIRPLSPDQIEEETDMLKEDYEQAQHIREAAGLSKPGQLEVPSTPSIAEGASTATNMLNTGAGNEIQPHPPADEPFAHEEDSQPAFAHEQRGNATIEDIDTIEHEMQDVSELPTSILERKTGYHDDNDDYLLPAIQESGTPIQESGTPIQESNTQSIQNRKETLDEDAEDIEEDNARRVHGTRPRRSRSGYLSSQTNEGEKQPTNENYGTQIINPRTFLDPTTSSASASRGGAREPDPVQLPTLKQGQRPTDMRAARARSGDLRSSAPRSGDLRSAGPRPSNLRSVGPRSSNLRGRNMGTPYKTPRPQRPSSGQTNTGLRKLVGATGRRGMTVLIAAVIVGLLALALLVYAGPTANVTLTMAAHTYTHTVDLTASNNNLTEALPARLLTKNFQKQGKEHAAGTKMEDIGKARGFVCFTNKSDSSVEIPTSSIVSASNGVQFATTADGVVLAHSTCTNDPLTFPIQAIKLGETGNVQAGSITIIPDTSLDAIAKYNKVATASLKLTVSNSEDVKGGGMQSVPAIAAKDLDNAKTHLSNQLKGEIDAWVQNLAKDGVTGTVVTNATLINSPLLDTPLDSDKTFTAEVAVKATILFVNTADLQKAALNQLKLDISQDKNYTGYTIAQGAKPALVISQLKNQATATSLKLNFSATAQAIPDVSKEVVQNLVSGKTPDAARKLLTSSIQGTQQVNIQVTPGFFPWVSWWKGHIYVTVLPGSASNNSPTHS